MSQIAPKFDHPPVVETVLGVQFNPLMIATAQLGIFWKEYLKEEWPALVEVGPLPEQREAFGDPTWGPLGIQVGMLKSLSMPLRVQVTNPAGDRMIQVQGNRFHYNWQKREGVYPSYQQIRAEFERWFDVFKGFVAAERLGEIVPNQWELTYVDFFPPHDLWQSPADWGKVLPGLLGVKRTPDRVRLETVGGEWRYEIEPQRGRLYLQLTPGKIGNEPEAGLMLQTTARGPVTPHSDSLGGLDLGHEVIIETFLAITSEEAQKSWGRKS